MRRTLITSLCIASLLAASAAAPAAHGGTQIRHYEAFGITQSLPSAPRVGDLALDFVFKNKRAKGKYTPRHLTRIRLFELPLFCPSPGPSQSLTADIATQIKLTKAPPPVTDSPKPNRYAYRFAWDFGAFADGSFTGTIDKANGKGWPRAHGKFTITRYDFPPPGPSNCRTSGQVGWSVPKQCKLPGQRGDLPLCRYSG
jgi:hypothetical protein